MNYSSFFLKQKARQALKGWWLTALLIGLVISLPSLLVQGAAVSTGYDLTTRAQEALLSSITEQGTLNYTVFAEKTDEILNSTGIWVMIGLRVLVWLITPCLYMGMYHWMMMRLRGEEGTVSVVFSRLKLFLKGMGLRLYITLMVFLFMLPGVALSVLSLLPLWTADSSSRIAVLSSANTSMGLMGASGIVMGVLGVMAALKYSMADILMAENTELGIREAARESRELMKGHRMQLFMVFLSFILWFLLENLAVGMISGTFGSISGLMVNMLCSLALSAYIYMTTCAFLRELKREREGETDLSPAQTTDGNVEL